MADAGDTGMRTQSSDIALSPELKSASSRWVQRRLNIIWALLIFNVLPPAGVPAILTLPQRIAQLLTMGALAVAFVLALSLNRRLLIRANVVLGLYTVLAVLSLVASVRGTAGLGGLLRSARLAGFLSVLWLLTPWWGQRDLVLARCHLRAVLGVCVVVLIGLVVAPSMALGGANGRLSGALWPIWPTAVAHFAAVAAGMSVVLWLAGSMAGKPAALIAAVGTAMVLLSHTRVALVGLVAGVICAALSLFLSRRRARRALVVALGGFAIAVVTVTSVISTWFLRGQSGEEIRGLTGRRESWEALVEARRPQFERWFGLGLTDKGFQGRPIDNSWLAIYQDQGLVGVGIVGATLVILLIAPAFVPPGPKRAVAMFIAVFCLVDSLTEVGLGDASPYLLDVAIAASLVSRR